MTSCWLLLVGVVFIFNVVLILRVFVAPLISCRSFILLAFHKHLLLTCDNILFLFSISLCVVNQVFSWRKTMFDILGRFFRDRAKLCKVEEPLDRSDAKHYHVCIVYGDNY